MYSIIHVKSEKQINTITDLFKEYVHSLGVDLWFQDFEKELGSLPGKYVPPDGCILLAMYGEKPAGCVALRKFETDICEMKRLYIKPEFRSSGLGRTLITEIIDESIDKGYKLMRLDTIDSLQQAIRLYKYYGFKEIEPYCYNPVPSTSYWELELDKYAKRAKQNKSGINEKLNR